MTYCTNCGAKLEGNERFCPLCGKTFNNLAYSPSTSEIESLKREVESLKEQLRKKETVAPIPQKKADNTCLICCIILILVMVFLGIFPFFLFYMYM